MKGYKFIRLTHGLMANHENYQTPKLVKAEFYENESNSNDIKVITTSGHNGEKLNRISPINLTRDEYLAIPDDAGTHEAMESLSTMGWYGF